jgi:hypothetical protein
VTGKATEDELKALKDETTAKFQEINGAYERVLKRKNGAAIGHQNLNRQDLGRLRCNEKIEMVQISHIQTAARNSNR